MIPSDLEKSENPSKSAPRTAKLQYGSLYKAMRGFGVFFNLTAGQNHQISQKKVQKQKIRFLEVF